MAATSVIGLQWGDEAKGKIVDLLTGQHDVVVRYQGGANAGHTVVTGGQTHKFSLLPSGILTPGVTCVIAGGVVINPARLLEEMDAVAVPLGGDSHKLLLSDRAHVIFPWHFLEDRVLDGSTSVGENIGTTQRGIGPCYRDKVGRSHAIRLGDMLRGGFREKIEHIVEVKNRILAAIDGRLAERIDAGRVYDEYCRYAERLRPYVVDTTEYLLAAAEGGKKLLLEGAQGALLDVDHGTYPFVTSSNSSGVGVSSGSGLPGRYVERVVGVLKAYSTRVGGGPFPTEQDNDTGQRLRDQGNEYGTVTRRPRRCGWIDAVALRYTTRLSGVDELSVMLLDVLAGLPEIQICTRYQIDGQAVSVFPSHVDDLRQAEPVYETMPGWRQDLSAVRRLEDLPRQARDYLDRISQLLDRPVGIVSVGPDREQTIFCKG